MFGRATITLGIGPHSSSYYLSLHTFPICFFLFFVLHSLLSLLLSLTFQNMDPLCFQAEPGFSLFVLLFAVFLVKDACLFCSCWFSFSFVM